MSEDLPQQLVALLPRLRRFAYSLTGSRDDGDDIVQSACERALSRLHQWRPGTRLDSWMFRIIQTTWIDRLRARRVRGEDHDQDIVETLIGDDGRRETEARIMLARVRKAIGRLPEEQRSVLVLVAVDGLSSREASDILDIPLGTVMSRLARARRRLHEMLNETNVVAFPQPASRSGASSPGVAYATGRIQA